MQPPKDTQQTLKPLNLQKNSTTTNASDNGNDSIPYQMSFIHQLLVFQGAILISLAFPRVRVVQT